LSYNNHKGGGASRPTQFIAVTAPGRTNGEYEKGPAIGLWPTDGGRGPLARGSIKGEYLDKLDDFIHEQAKNRGSVSFAIFESNDDKRGGGGRGRSREDDRDRDRDDDRDRDRYERSGSRDKGRDDREESFERETKTSSRKPASRSKAGPAKKSGKAAPKGKSWKFDK
jgi:hypothetical protein